jgi:YidC/Oxa1 family membrane protein insertase
MVRDLFYTFLFEPLYNGLIFFISIVPFADVGIAVMLLTVVVKIVLLPLSVKAVRTQVLAKELEPELARIREKHKSDKGEQAKQTMALYREKGINPFSSFFLILLQIPIIFALYWVFFRGGLPTINEEFLYSFISTPEAVNMEFLGLIDVSGRSIIFALAAGISQFFQVRLTLPAIGPRTSNVSFKEDLARSFQLQMKYVLPVVVAVISYSISAAVALYWATSNIFAIGQELLIIRRLKKKLAAGREMKT